jgi:hypothetical protein
MCFSFVLISQNELKSVLKCLARFHADGIAFLKKNSEAKYPFLQVHAHCKDTVQKIRNKKFIEMNCAALFPISTFLCAIYIFHDGSRILLQKKEVVARGNI